MFAGNGYNTGPKIFRYAHVAGFFMQSNRNSPVVVTFYRFVFMPDFREMRREILDYCINHNIKGTILLAEEGINGTIAGRRDEIDAVLDWLRHDERLRDMEHKESCYDGTPFYRMKVKIKKEIVTMGIPGINPAWKNGRKVNATEWNRLINDPDVVVIDTRNHYEYEIGTFKNAVSPRTNTFSEFPEYAGKNLAAHREKKIAMFCTGGIRCEKATSYLLEQGFEQVFHLDGGILKYLEQVSPENNLWQGDCFVFDHRVAVDKNLEKSKYTMCYGCRMPVSMQDRQSDKYEEGVSCPRCFNALDEEKKRNLRQRQFQVRLAESRNQQHIGIALKDKVHSDISS